MPTPLTAAPAGRFAGAAVAALLLLTGCSSSAADTSAASNRSNGSDSSNGSGGSATSDAPPAPEREKESGTSESPPPAADPAHVAIPSLKVSSTLMPLGLNKDGTVEVPPAEKGMTAGWYTGGAKPGQRGPAVIIGHNDTRYGRAVFHDLKNIAKGADIAVRNKKGATLHFTVVGTETVSKTAFPTKKVYGATEGPELRLVTCDGAFDAQGHPVDNLIVYATLKS
ncbi:class F sortase [Streptomyces sp. NPDC091292]|uniref:class F sortase n=1 Tax=Streptomyces sp. NPDC091292 TaxID=3365991 RepID=UPI003820A2FD